MKLLPWELTGIGFHWMIVLLSLFAIGKMLAPWKIVPVNRIR